MWLIGPALSALGGFLHNIEHERSVSRWVAQRDTLTIGVMMHDIIGDIIEWNALQALYLANEGAEGERYFQRIEAAARMADIEARWELLPGGFAAQRRLITGHVAIVAELAGTMTPEELCWQAIAAASAWLPNVRCHRT